MTRQHLYKAQRTDGRGWVEGGISKCEKDGKWFITNMGVDHISHIGWHQEVNPESVCEATGLLDKNGRMIFEGDVVHCVSRTDAGEMVVIFEEGEFRMVLCENYANYSTGMGFYAIRCFSKEILSNIHDKEVRDE